MIKRTILATLAVLAISFSSCVRDEDKDLLNHPIHITGKIDPHFGIPIAYTSLNINDVLSILGNYDQYIDTLSDDELITIKYDTSFVNEFEINQTFMAKSSKRNSNAKYGDVVYSYDTIIEGEQTFNIFNGLDILQEVSVSQVLLNWKADVGAKVSNDIDTLIDQFGVKLYIDDISLFAFNSANPDETVELAIETGDSILLNNMFGESYETISLLNNYDASPILKVLPDQVKYKAAFHITVPDTAFAIDITQFLKDSLHFESVTVKSDVNAKFPINLNVEHFAQTLDTIPIDVSATLEDYQTQIDNIEGLEATIEDSYLTLQIVNGLPLDIKLKVDVCDTNLQSLFLLADTTDGFLSAAPITQYSENRSLYVSNGTTKTNVKFLLNQERLEQLKQARNIIVTAVLSTPKNNNESQQVAPKRSDEVGIKIYAKIHASANLDIPLTNGPLIEMKGGVK